MDKIPMDEYNDSLRPAKGLLFSIELGAILWAIVCGVAALLIILL